MGKSDVLEDAYKFRTPMLRNVALSAPYGHNGAYPTLEGIVRHHIENTPVWTRGMAHLPKADWFSDVDFAAQDNRFERQRHARFRDTSPIPLTDSDIAHLVDFLNALTGASVDQAPFGVPDAVPSGLPLD
jgi:cytochrome c peroxidase